MSSPSQENSEEGSYCSQASSADGFDDMDELPNASEEPVQTVMSGFDLVTEQNAQISQIAALFEVPLVTASVLLRKFAWSTERLIEAYYEDPDRVLDRAGVTAKRQRSEDSDGGGQGEVTCAVCFCDVPRGESSANDRCGHRFCNDCWAGHLGVQIREGNANGIVCMHDKCSTLVDAAMVQALVDAPTFAAFARFAQKQFVDDNPYLKWCPARDCDKVIKVRDLGATEVQCSCGMLFCFGCAREAHFPISCEQLNRWEDKNASDSGTGQWMQCNTKRCPKCNARVEKNGGCNWISCRCGHQFCYFCFSTAANHHGAVCNAPPTKEAKNAQSELDYYMHYFDRWNGHRLSQELEVKLREDAREKMEALVADLESAHLLVEVQHLGEATEQLIECRRVLKSTYPFAFYLDRGPEKNLFEDLQGRLEAQTEQLSAALEAEEAMQKETFAAHKVKLLNLTADAKLRLRHLREGIEQGLLPPPATPPAGVGAGSSADPIVL